MSELPTPGPLDCDGDEYDVIGGTMNLGIVGMGAVGKAVYAYHKDRQDVMTYDIATDEPEDMARLNECCDVVFICVSTPYAGEGKGLDCSNVWDAVSKLTRGQTVIIKSTVMPGTTDALQVKYPDLRLFFVPEFLNEATAAHDYAYPERPHIVGVAVNHQLDVSVQPLNHVADLLPGISDNAYVLPACQAELLKLLTNSFYALKVTFTNFLFDAGATQDMLDVQGTDPRFGNDHYRVFHRDYRGFGGKCLVKDCLALRDYADGIGQRNLAQLLTTIHEYNADLLRSQGIDWQVFAGMTM